MKFPDLEKIFFSLTCGYKNAVKLLRGWTGQDATIRDGMDMTNVSRNINIVILIIHTHAGAVQNIATLVHFHFADNQGQTTQPN